MTTTLTRDAARDVLELVDEAITAAGRPQPPIRFVSHGRPAIQWNCDVLAVWIAGVAPIASAAMPSPLAQLGNARSRVVVTAMIVRCWPSADGADDPAVLQPVAEGLDVDAWAMWDAWRTGLTSKSLWGACRASEMLACVPVEPQGGFAGWELSAGLEA